jgi:hypothetical protein
MTTVALQPLPQVQTKTENLINYMIVLQSKEIEDQDGYPVPVDTQMLKIPFWESQKVDREFVTNWLDKNWFEDYHLVAIEPLHIVGQEPDEF